MALDPTPNEAVKWKVLPTPAWLSTQMLPSIISTRRFEMESPRPVPPYLRVVEVSACEKYDTDKTGSRDIKAEES